LKVHYRSRLARVALPRKYIAVTLWDHVFTRLDELEESILRHEEVHVRQWKRHGLLRFAALYVWYHLRYGYWRNPFEVEARSEEMPGDTVPAPCHVESPLRIQSRGAPRR